MSSELFPSPLAKPDDLPLCSADTVTEFGSTLVVAPHPDDESLGCGGAIALLRSLGCPVQVLVISDGTLSHPRSRRYPTPVLQALREDETKAALWALGVSSSVTFLRLKDGSIPEPGAIGFEQALSTVRSYIEAFQLKTILLPWRHDPHPDHRATWSLVHTAVTLNTTSVNVDNRHISRGDPISRLYRHRCRLPRLIEYPIWDWDPDQRTDNLVGLRVKAWRLDISAVLSQKQTAIAAHRSQTTDLIDDDPEGFRLTPEMLGHFAHPWEIYLEADCDE